MVLKIERCFIQFIQEEMGRTLGRAGEFAENNPGRPAALPPTH
jgi:hypothetical protein